MISTERSADTTAVVERLRECRVGGLVTWDDLSRCLGRDAKRCRHVLASAIRIVRREDGAHFESERGLGYRRVPAQDAHLIGNAARTKIRRTARRSRQHITQVIARTNDLPDDAARLANREVSALGLMEHLSRDSAQPEKEECKAQNPEPVGITAKLMLGRLVGS